MYAGLAISFVLHLGLLAWALFTIQQPPTPRVPMPEPVSVDMITASELTRLMQGARDAKPDQAAAKEAPTPEPEPKKDPPKPKREPAAAPPPPPPPPPEPKQAEPSKPEPVEEKVAALPEPKPEPKPDPGPTPEERQKLEDQLKADEQRRLDEQKRAEEKRRADEKKRLADEKRKADEKKRLAELKRKEDEKKKQFDAEKISALLNKVPDKSAPPAASTKAEPLAKAKGPAPGAPEGRDTQLSASELAVIAQIIRTCVQSKWIIQGGGEDAQGLVVKMRLRFNPDGTLAVLPQLMNPQGTAFFLAASDSALRAAKDCEPYNLPPAKYDSWKDIVLTFNPRANF